MRAFTKMRTEWPHDVHPCEEHMLLHGVPEVRIDIMEAGLAPIYELDEDCYTWTVLNGCLMRAHSSYSRTQAEERHFVWTGAQKRETVESELVRAGCTMIQLVRIKVNDNWGGIGFKAMRSHLKCGLCTVAATMQM